MRITPGRVGVALVFLGALGILSLILIASWYLWSPTELGELGNDRTALVFMWCTILFLIGSLIKMGSHD